MPQYMIYVYKIKRDDVQMLFFIQNTMFCFVKILLRSLPRELAQI